MSSLLGLLLSARATALDANEAAWVARWRRPPQSKQHHWHRVAGPIDVSCTFSYRLGLAKDGQSAAGPALDLSFDQHRSFVSAPHAPESAAFSKTPRLCQHTHDAVDGAPAHVMVTSSLEYLFRLWPYFLNHVRHAEQHKRRFFVWVGELPEGLATTVGNNCRHSTQGPLLLETGMLDGTVPVVRRLKSVYYQRRSDTTIYHSNHYNKMPAALSVLDHPRVGGVFYGDLDSYYDTGRDDIAKLHADPTVDYAAFTNSGPEHAFWNVKGCAFYARDAPLSKRLLEAWLRDRCGFKDQYPYWHAILVEGSAASCLDYNGEIYRMRSYDAMKKGVARYPALDVPASALRQKCPSFTFRPHKFARPLHRSVGPDAVVTFGYLAGGAARALNVSNALAKADEGGDLLGALGLAALDAAVFY